MLESVSFDFSTFVLWSSSWSEGEELDGGGFEVSFCPGLPILPVSRFGACASSADEIWSLKPKRDGITFWVHKPLFPWTAPTTVDYNIRAKERSSVGNYPLPLVNLSQNPRRTLLAPLLQSPSAVHQQFPFWT